MKIGLVGGSYQERSLPLDAQRTINLYPVVDETQQGKEVSALYGTPGKRLFGTAGAGPMREAYTAANGRAFFVSGNKLYELSSGGSATERGTLLTSNGNLTVDENGSQLGLCDGTYGYIFTYATNVLAQITDSDFPTATSLTFIDGYFAVSKANSGQFFISALYNGTSWDALDFATAESSPDDLVRVYNAVGQLWLFGKRTTEIWTNTGNTVFPFERIQGAKMDMGLLAAHSVVSIDNSVFWLGRDTKGQGIVYRAKGFSPERISTHAIEYLLQASSSLENIKGYTYQQDGHTFYVLTGEGLNTTLVYDLSTGLWHERAFLNTQGEYEIDLGSCYTFAFSKHLVGDRLNSNVYEMSLDVFKDGDYQIKRQRTFTHIHEEGEPIRVQQLAVEFEGGVGLTSGQGSNPQCWLEVSEDFGRTWGDEYYASIGALGQYRTRAEWRKLGYAYQFTFRVSISDPVKVAICGAYLKT
jgi:hypothetical protein